MNKVDIIVPVYNALEYTSDCINSVIKNTNLNENNLILINDKSPDDKIILMLKKYKEQNAALNIIVLENDKNIGFVKTVNKGMQYSNNDVILLNSDTEVTKNWLEKMYKCAYSNSYIATVTPLTNNGTIASVPNFGIDNDLPSNMNLTQYAEMIEKISKNIYPQLTTGNGFCMFIKRDVINEIGLFDDSTFEKGYGEENDFCYRALDYGYINVLCDDTFIYHKGTQSFKKENLTASRASLIEEHMKLLTKKHPIYVRKTDAFIGKNPLSDIQQNINLNIILYNKKKILYLINEWEENMEMTGGTSLHLKDIIASNLEHNIASFVLAPDKNDLSRFNLYLYVNGYNKKIANYITDINDYGQIKYTNDSYKQMLINIFKSFNIDILHVQHFLFQTFDAIDVAKDFNVYSIITLHDLYMICPSINMVYRDRFCKYDNQKNCLKCLNKRFGINSNIIQNWQTTSLNILKKFDKILVPSENTKKMFEEVYKNLNIEVVEHGVKVINVNFENNKYRDKNDKKFNIAFVGAMAIHKGINILKSMVNENKSNNIVIHLFGKSSDKFLSHNRNNFINHGEYKRGELPQLLVDNNIDLVCILTTWPETYSYTLTETYMAQIPVLTFDIGAIGDRVQADDLGWAINFNTNTKEILEKIKYICNNKSEYVAKKNNFKRYEYKTIEEMQKYYKKLYKDSNQLNENNRYIDGFKFINYKKISIEKEYEIYRALYGHVIYKYEKIRNSKLWKIAKKVKSKI